jgi:hypothetical protein
LNAHMKSAVCKRRTRKKTSSDTFEANKMQRCRQSSATVRLVATFFIHLNMEKNEILIKI